MLTTALELAQGADELASVNPDDNVILYLILLISLEALGHRPEAAEAFRRAIATGSLTEDLRRFAETRLRETQ